MLNLSNVNQRHEASQSIQSESVKLLGFWTQLCIGTTTHGTHTATTNNTFAKLSFDAVTRELCCFCELALMNLFHCLVPACTADM